ncbi:UDP-glucose 4-epimerase [Meredithblackwellia eburnea MCA 4105]
MLALEQPVAIPPPLPSPNPSLHIDWQPHLLRDIIHDIVDRQTPEPESEAEWNRNVVVSHPPSPTTLRATTLDHGHLSTGTVSDLRPLNSISPLDPTSLTRIPLSTPPTPPPAVATSRKQSTKDHTRARVQDEMESEEQQYPLIVVTGGSGFIGSHTVLEILQEGHYGVVVLDNLENSHLEVLHRVRLLASRHHSQNGLPLHRHPPLYFHTCDIQDRGRLAEVFALYALPQQHPEDEGGGGGPRQLSSSRIVSAIHFAALKSVSGSLLDPLSYYQVNVSGTINLVEILAKWRCKKLVFSSSCVVYGAEADGEGILEEQLDVRRGASKGITNPYGRTKRMCEEILADLSTCDPEWFTMSLRYTNPSGAHPSGYIGEDPQNAANLMPIVTQVLQGKREFVKIYGADYPTPDGTGVRDFIHVVDLAKAHLAAIREMNKGNPLSRNATYNLGTNRGTSVLTVIETLSTIAQRPIKMVICPRRPGDLGCVVCCADKAERELGWKAERSIVEMCRDLINWQALNPTGYASEPGPNETKDTSVIE